MKRIISFFLLLMQIVLLTACAQHSEAREDGLFSPFFLDDIALTKEAICNKWNLAQEEIEVNDAGTQLRMLNRQAEICGHAFAIQLKFDTAGTLYGFDSYLPASDLTQEEIYELIQDISTILTDAYGVPKTYPRETNIQNWSGAEDIVLEESSVDRWLVPGAYTLSGYADEDVIMVAQLSYYADLHMTSGTYIAVSYDLRVHPLSSYEQEHGIAL